MVLSLDLRLKTRLFIVHCDRTVNWRGPELKVISIMDYTVILLTTLKRFVHLNRKEETGRDRIENYEPDGIVKGHT